MIHLFKYRFKQIIRDFPMMFWALAFPIILGTFFYFSFGTAGLAATGEADWESIPVTIVTRDDTSENARYFSTFLTQMDGDAIDIHDISTESQALDALKEGTILGIYYIDKEPSLTIGKNGLNESILTSLLDNYNRNASMFQEIAIKHPEALADAMANMNDYPGFIEEKDLGGSTLNPNVQYFFVLIAYACLSGTYLGVRSSMDCQANLTPLGARRSITPTKKLTLITIDLLVLITIHFFNILILNLYINKVLGISLGTHTISLILIDFMGSLIGVCLGLALGCLSKVAFNAKIGLCTTVTLLFGFLSGLMFGNMKNIIEHHVPLLNRINPAAVLSDAYYCIGVYNDTAKLNHCFITLLIMSIVLFGLAFLGVRRERYDSI